MDINIVETPTTFASVINILIRTLNLLIPLIIGLALLSFIYGLFLYIGQAGDESKRKEGLSYIVYGIIGFFVMVSVWSLIGILTGTFFGIGVGIPEILISQ